MKTIQTVSNRELDRQAACELMDRFTTNGTIQYKEAKRVAPNLWKQLSKNGTRNMGTIYALIGKVRTERNQKLQTNGIHQPARPAAPVEPAAAQSTNQVPCRYCPVCGSPAKESMVLTLA